MTATQHIPRQAPRPEQLAGMKALPGRFGSHSILAEWIRTRMKIAASQNRVVGLLRKAERSGALAIDDAPGCMIVYYHPQRLEKLLDGRPA